MGDTICAETTLLDKRESSGNPDHGIVSVETRGFNQHGETVIAFRRRALVPKRDTADPLVPVRGSS
jgi:acyl dehydratase